MILIPKKNELTYPKSVILKIRIKKKNILKNEPVALSVG